MDNIGKTVILSRELIAEMDELFNSFHSQALFARDLNMPAIAYKLGLLQGHLERDLTKFNKD